MKNFIFKISIVLGITAAGIIWNGNFPFTYEGCMTTADARVGRPATPVSYAGVARRTTVRVVTPGVGAPGVGVAPGNRGGPVNRVGVR